MVESRPASTRGVAELMADDELFGVKNAYYLGLYQQAISEALSTSVSSEAARVDSDFVRFMAYIAQGQQRMVLDEVGTGSPLGLQGVKLLATYVGASRETKDMVLMQLKEWLSDATALSNSHLVEAAAVIYCHEQDYKEALKYVHHTTLLSTMYLVVQIYIGMNRLDLAKKQLSLMQTQDDDATVTQLASAWVGMSEGGEKAQEALNTFQDLGEKYNMSPMLTNGMAMCNMALGRFDEAERLLQDTLSKSATDADTLANVVVCMSHLQKPQEQVARYTNQLRSVAPAHPWAQRYGEMEAAFDRSAMQMSG